MSEHRIKANAQKAILRIRHSGMERKEFYEANVVDIELYIAELEGKLDRAHKTVEHQQRSLLVQIEEIKNLKYHIGKIAALTPGDSDNG